MYTYVILYMYVYVQVYLSGCSHTLTTLVNPFSFLRRRPQNINRYLSEAVR